MEQLETGRNYLKQASDGSESSECSSCSSDSESEKLPWMEEVQSDGTLFFVEYHEEIDPLIEDYLNDPCSVELRSHREKSKLNAAEKIKKWMKGRRKKRRESFPLKTNSGDKNSNSTEDSFLHYITKEIYINVDIRDLLPNSKFSASEQLFGLNIGSNEDKIKVYDKPTVIGFTSACETSGIKIGDIIKSVNDVEINMRNMEDVLKSIPVPSKVKLTVSSPLKINDSEIYLSSSKRNNLLKELLWDSEAMEQARLQFVHIPHGLFFMSTESEDIEYKYPDDNTSLFKLKGLFQTLAHMVITELASPPVLSCSLMVKDEVVHVGFVKEDAYIMILVLPATIASCTEVQHFSTALAKLLKYQSSSLYNAFSSEHQLDNFLTLFFKDHLSQINYSQRTSAEQHLLGILPTVHWLPLPDDLKTEIDDILSELESAYFDIDSKGFYKNRRIFNIFGSCLFYKGYLLNNHLPKEDLLDIHLFLHYNHILELTRQQPISQIIIWREVFPSRHQIHLANPDPEFEETRGRWFILVVVMEHCILAALLDDGGCSLNIEGNPPPHPFYVEEVQNTLFILHDCGIPAAVEKLLHFCVLPEASSDLFNVDNACPNCHGKSVTANGFCVHCLGPNEASNHSFLTEKGPADGESDSESSHFSGSYENIPSLENRFRSCSLSTGSTTKSHGSNSEHSQTDDESKSHRNFSSLPNLSGIDTDGMSFKNSFRMVTGFRNNLIYYLHMDPVEGIFISPVLHEASSLGSIPSSILANFRKCCLNMRTVFERSLRNGEMAKANIKTKYGVNKFLQNAYEQGVLFVSKEILYKHKASSSPASFWVIGRLFFTPEPREIYVCYHDLVPPDMVEIAFQLGFGLSL